MRKVNLKCNTADLMFVCLLFPSQVHLEVGHFGRHGYLVARLVVRDSRSGIGHVSREAISAWVRRTNLGLVAVT